APNPNGLALSSDATFYGTTAYGGDGYGIVFRVTTTGAFTPLASFADTDGSTPQSALTLGIDGAFYGTTFLGGSTENGTVFRVTTNGVIAPLASFSYDNGAYPQAPLLLGSD